MNDTQPTDGSTPLKGRRETFCQLYSKGDISASEAYRQAGYSHKRADALSAQIMVNNSVKARIAYLKAEYAKKWNIDRETFIKLCFDQLAMAQRQENVTGGNGALALIGKAAAILTDVVRDERSQGVLSDERRAELAEQAKQLNQAPTVIKLSEARAG